MNSIVPLRTISSLLFMSLLASCTSFVPLTKEPGDDIRHHATRSQIEMMLSDGRYGEAVQHIDAHKRIKMLLPTTILDMLFAEAVDGIVQDFYHTIDEADHPSAIVHYQSLLTLQETARVPEWDLGQIYLEYADMLADQENYVAALHTFIRIPMFWTLDAGIIDRYMRIAIDYSIQYPLQRMVELLDTHEKPVDADAYRALKDILTIQEMIAGTATILIDRGIRITEGRGYLEQGIGSAFFIDPRGYLLTNYHVISSEVDPTYEGYSRIYVRLADNYEQRIPARVVGYSRLFDIALIKIEVTSDILFSLDGTRNIDIGTEVIAIGSPGGLQNSLTSGIVSAIRAQPFLQIGEILQVDVAVNPGNSGGPLIDRTGNLVGVNFATAIDFEGINFTIPSYWLEKFVVDMYTEGAVAHPWIGASLHRDSNGLMVIYTTPYSPAAITGLEEGDYLRTIQGVEVNTLVEVQDVMLQFPVNSVIKIEWMRDGTMHTGLVRTDTRAFSPVEEALKVENVPRLFGPLFGMKANEIRSSVWQKDYVVKGVYSGTIADNFGLSVEDSLSIFGWNVDYEQRIVSIVGAVKKRTQGFLPERFVLFAPLETNNFI